MAIAKCVLHSVDNFSPRFSRRFTICLPASHIRLHRGDDRPIDFGCRALTPDEIEVVEIVQLHIFDQRLKQKK